MPRIWCKWPIRGCASIRRECTCGHRTAIPNKVFVSLQLLSLYERELKIMLRKLWKDEAAFIVSAELILITTILILSLVVGLSEIAEGINHELNDVSNVFGSIRQEYSYDGFERSSKCGHGEAFVSGSRWADHADPCDQPACEKSDIEGVSPAQGESHSH